MRTLFLQRRYFEHGTFSYLYSPEGEQLCAVVEREWNNNQPNISCIPQGEYTLVPHHSPRFGDCYALVAPSLGVTIHGPSLRTHILFHVANLPEQLEGCLAPGMGFGVVKNQWGVVNSTIAFDKLMEYLGGDEWKLVISQ